MSLFWIDRARGDVAEADVADAGGDAGGEGDQVDEEEDVFDI